MRITKSTQPTPLASSGAAANADDPASTQAAPAFDTDKFVGSARDPEKDMGGGSYYGTSGSSSGYRSR